MRPGFPLRGASGFHELGEIKARAADGEPGQARRDDGRPTSIPDARSPDRFRRAASTDGKWDRERLLDVGQASLQEIGDLGRGLEAPGRVLVHQADDDRLQPGGDLGVDVAERPGLVVADATEHGQRRLGPERRMARTHGVERAAQAEEVGAMVGGLAAGLLGRHVVRRAGHDAAVGQRRRRPPRGPGRSRSAGPARRRSPAGCWPA